MTLRSRGRGVTVIAVLAALAMILGPALSLSGGTVVAQDSQQRTITVELFVCPPGMTGQTLAPEECDPLVPDDVDVEIISLNGTAEPLTAEDAQSTENTLLWSVTGTGEATDEWGIRQTALPPNTRAYVVQGEGVELDQQETHDYTFTTSAEEPDALINLYVLLQEGAPVIPPPGTTTDEADDTAADDTTATEEAPTDTAADTVDDATTDDTATEDAADDDAPDTAEATDTEADQTDPEFAVGDTVVTTEDSVNLRANTGTNAEIVAELEAGTVLIVLSSGIQANGYLWYEVGAVGDGDVTGWIAADFIALAPEEAAADTETTTTAADTATGETAETPAAADDTETATTAASTTEDAGTVTLASLDVGSRVVIFDGPLNLRSAAGTGGSVVEVLPQDAVLTILSGPVSMDGFRWYEVETELGETGYVADAFIAPLGFQAGDVVFVNTDALNVRSEPGMNSTVLQVIFENTVATITNGPEAAEGVSWYEIDVEGVVLGWVAGQYLAFSDAPPVTPSGEFAAGSWAFVIDPPVNLRESASTDGTIIRSLPDGEGMLVLAGPTDAGGYSWYQVEDDGDIGWVAGEFLGGGFFTGRNAVVADGPLNLRSAPGTGSDIVATLTQDELVSVLNVSPTIINGEYWFQVTTGDSVTGFVAGRYLGAP
jgi:uncharacterized protein YgiM (DUF1202 family)